MNTTNLEQLPTENNLGISWGNFSAVLFAIALMLGITWMKQPQLFSLHKNNISSAASANVPKYYAYVDSEPAQPLVAGANTFDGPSLINEDGSVSPVDMGEVLGASTEGVELSLEDVKVNTVPDSQKAMEEYLSASQKIENGPIENGEFETALSSGRQELIDKQSEKLEGVKNSLQKLAVPVGLAKLQKLKIIQYSAAIGVLKNFTQADTNPELVGKYLQEFLKSQQDLDAENESVAQKYNLDPLMLGVIPQVEQ